MVKIGVDIRPLQTGHKVRGIGQVTRQVTAQLDELKQPDDQLVLYLYENGDEVDTLPFGEDAILQYVPQPKYPRISKVFPSLNRAADAIIRNTCDVYIQYDFKMGLPKGHQNILLIHDQIPVLFGNKYPYSYLSTYRTARRVGLRRRDALVEKALRRWVYVREMRKTLDRATEVLAVSKYTAKDTLQFASPNRQRTLEVKPALLGFTQPQEAGKLLNIEKARLDALNLRKGNFLFFIGGVDDRRRIDQLVTAFNNLRALGHDIKLVLGGHDFQPDMHAIFSPAARRAIETSSYRDDICLLGFISERERGWLYENAKAFVFPTEYEGFGLPILESLAEGCPVVTYKNSAVPEVAGPNVLMVEEGWEGIIKGVEQIDARSAKESEKLAHEGKEWTKKFSWNKTAKVFMEAVRRII